MWILPPAVFFIAALALASGARLHVQHVLCLDVGEIKTALFPLLVVLVQLASHQTEQIRQLAEREVPKQTT